MSGYRRKENRRRGCRTVLWALALFLLAQVSGGLVLDYLCIRVRFPWLADVYENLRARARQPEIIFLGSSRFASDFNCGVLDAALRHDLGEGAPRTFNAAVPAGDATVAERMLDDFLRMGYRPKLIVLEVAPGILARRDNWLNHQALRLLDWRDVPDAFPALCRNGKIMYLLPGRLLPLYLHRYGICKEALAMATSLFHPQPGRALCDPAVPAPVQTDPEPPPPPSPVVLAQVKASCKEVSWELQNFQLGGMASGRLERLLDRCRAEGIAVLLLGVPVSSHFRRAIPDGVDGIFLAYLRRLTQRYGCWYCDWSDRLPDSYFVDEHHAHPGGAVYLSRRLAPSVLVPLWRDIQGPCKGTDPGKGPRIISNSL